MYQKDLHKEWLNAIQELGIGEALISVLDESGVPSIVERANILPPRSSMSAVDDTTLQAVVNSSVYKDKYSAEQDNESAFEQLTKINEQEAEEKETETKEKKAKEQTKSKSSSKSSSGRKKQSVVEKAVNSTANTIGREIGKKVVRGIFGSFLK